MSTNRIQDGFPLVAEGRAAALFVSSDDHAGVVKVARDLQADIARLTGVEPELAVGGVPSGEVAVLIGSVGKIPLVDGLVAGGKFDSNEVVGRWEIFGLQTVERPLPGVERALVIFGSDKRGTIFGIYDLATRMGVSPWHWWADVPV